MKPIIEVLKSVFWKLPIPMRIKSSIRNKIQKNNKEKNTEIAFVKCGDSSSYGKYVEQVLNRPVSKSISYKDFIKHDIVVPKSKLIAYYLTQYHPTEKNNLWWGKGTTEWTNVTKAVPQFAGHLQPKLPGALGFYDLRLVENMKEQISLAKNYSIYGFCFYYYWFNGERALELPLNNYINDSSLDLPFSICWCNEDWTKRYNGISNQVLLSVGKTVDSYKRFIEDVLPMFKDQRYIRIDNRPMLVIYRPSLIPETKSILDFWREKAKSSIGSDLYIIASQEARIDFDWTTYGFDAISQFQPASISTASPTDTSVHPIRNDFDGQIYDYSKIVDEKIGITSIKQKKVYPAVMPAWDNTSRRNQHATIYNNSTPEKYEIWLGDAIKYSCNNIFTEDNLVFINAWNEWGEGAYLEPDREFGYSYLEATYEANNGEKLE